MSDAKSAGMSRAQAWAVYVKERFPLATYALLVGGLAISASVSGPEGVSAMRPGGLGLAALGILMFFAELRLMDEYKDYRKDLVAHPQRPLPRGVLKVEEVGKTIQAGAWVMALYGLALWELTGWLSSVLYLFTTAYLWLMYREFYVGEKLADYPLIYAITHQIILLPLSAFALAAATGAPLFETVASRPALAYSIAVLGSFFSYEVCRKLDPRAHPVLKTYLAVYGPAKTALIVVGLTGVAAYGARGLGMEAALWPVEALLLVSLAVLFKKPGKFKIVEGMATLSLVFHIWGLAVARGLELWRSAK